MKILEKLKKILCEHDYNYWGKEDICLNNENITTTHTLICSRCKHQIIIRDRRK